MEEKTIKYLVERAENAKQVSNKLGEESAEFAIFISKKMDDIGIRKLVCEDGYSVHNWSMRSSVASENFMSSGDDEYRNGGDLLSKTISNDSTYLHGDFNCEYNYKTAEETLEFVAHAKDLLLALDKVITEIENAKIP